MMKRILIKGAMLLPFALLYNVLEMHLGDTWLPVAIVLSLMVVARASLYIYRRSKGIEDTWPND